MANRKPIPHINVPIMQANGSMELAWYLFLQWVSENAGAADLSDYFTKEETQALLNAKADVDDLAEVAFSGSYNDLSNKPTIGNATIIIKQGGITKGSFTVNQTGNEEIDIDQGGSDIDNLTITKNTDDEIQAVATVNQNTATGATNPVYDWVGTLAEYQAQNIETLHPNWLCYITDDIGGGDSVYTKAQIDNMFSDMLNAIWPVGSTYIGTQNTCPMAVLIPNSTWVLVAQDRALWGGNGSNANTTIAAGLPNITGSFATTFIGNQNTGVYSGAFTSTKYNPGQGASSNGSWSGYYNFNASLSSSVYGNSSTVQPPAYIVNVWRRTA